MSKNTKVDNKKDVKGNDSYYNDPLVKDKNNSSPVKDRKDSVKSKTIEKIRLPESQVVDNIIINIQNKTNPMSFNDCYLKLLSVSNNVDSNLISAISNEVLNINKEKYEKLYNKIESISEEKKNISSIIKNESNSNYNLNNVMNKEKLKELDHINKDLINKKQALEEEQKLLEIQENIIKNNVSLSGTINPNMINSILEQTLQGKDLIDHNLRQSRLKEIKSIKDQLDIKLTTMKQHVDKILKEEESLKFDKKDHIKNYIKNFNANKQRSISPKVIEREYKQKEKKILEMEKKIQEMADAEKLERIKKYNTNKEIALKIHSEEKNIYKKIKEKNEKIEKIANIKNKPKKYSYSKIKENYEKQVKEKEIEKLKELEVKKQQRKLLFKPINREELNEFAKKFDEELEKLNYEKEKKRLIKLEEIVTVNSTLQRYENNTYNKIKKEDKEIKDKYEKEKLNKVFKTLKVQNFSKIIHEKLPPKADKKKREEIEERLERMTNNHKRNRKAKAKKRRVLLFSRNPNKKAKTMESQTTQHDNVKTSQSKPSPKIKERIISKVEIRKPLDKLPDYLSEIRVKKQSDSKYYLIINHKIILELNHL